MTLVSSIPRAYLVLTLVANLAIIMAALTGYPEISAFIAAGSAICLVLHYHDDHRASLLFKDVGADIAPLNYRPWLDARNGGLAGVDIIVPANSSFRTFSATSRRAFADAAGWTALRLGMRLPRALLRRPKLLGRWLSGVDRDLFPRLEIIVPLSALRPWSRTAAGLSLLRREGILIRVNGDLGRRAHADAVMLPAGWTAAKLAWRADANALLGRRVMCASIDDADVERKIISSGVHLVSGGRYVEDIGAEEVTAMLPLSDAAIAKAAGRRAGRKAGMAPFASLMPAMLRRSERDLLADLRHGFDNGEVSLHYQPKMKCRTNEVDSVEALIRWTHPVRGAVGPAQFIPLAERSGDILTLTWWTLERAVIDQRRMMQLGLHVDMSVNISAGLISDPRFIAEAIKRLETRHGNVAFEITETAIIEDPDAALEGLERLVDAGINLSIDDYGVGMSSLTYLKRVPAKELKIDRLFSAELTKSHNDPMLMRSSIDLAHGLGMEVTAEGIETEAALALLRVMGCDRVQGYLTGRPMPLEELVEHVREQRHLKALDGHGAGFTRAANFW
ncbi:EAL domain-containing protein [Pacificimonas sp. WHA3]|uniref:EAL domain-containing protein n=1 Tax=Pacificimonas pallii TaxID=2827236 RepID=A0ABS6S9Y7_9SPHN|nr:EAL domain-containing protein [Pacificimonas pallii]MBV7255159.1 EAL domain-containing protein [Pacificimonas pallii]